MLAVNTQPDKSGSRLAICNAILLAMLAICALASGCQDTRTIWSSEVRSPGGDWLASASTVAHYGPGTAGAVSSIYLKRTNNSSRPTEILEFFHHERSPSSKINLTMKWETPTHLAVTYDGRAASLEFQAIKCGGVDISVQDLSKASDGPQHSQ